MTFNPRAYYYFVAILCVSAVGIALISQHAFGMRPCAWCVLQRLLLLMVGVFAVAAALCSGGSKSALARVLAGLGSLTALGGVVAAWYQYTVASNSFSCDLSVADTIMTKSGLESTLPFVFGIYATCLDARVELLGVEYALWGMAIFIITLALLIYTSVRQRSI